MEDQPHPQGGEHFDPDEQAREVAARQRAHDQANVAHLIELGMTPDDAAAFLDFERFVRGQPPTETRSPAPQTLSARPEETNPGQAVAEDRERTRRYRPRVLVSTLTDGAQADPGRWLDADREADELEADIAALPRESSDPAEGRWAIRDSADFAGLDPRGCGDTGLVARLARGVVEDGAAYAAYVAIVGTEDAEVLDRFRDFHVGSYDSPEAWARAVGEDLQWEAHLDQVVDPMLRPHVAIDYAHVAREARQSWMSWRGTTAAPMCSCDNHPSGHLPGGLWLPTFTRPAPRGAGERPHHTEEGTISHD